MLLVTEGDRVCADARIIDGSVTIDLSSLTGESLPTTRAEDAAAVTGPLLEARDLVFSGTTCTGGEASTVVTRTGMFTELGRIAALSQRGRTVPSPLERQVRRVTWIIAAVAMVIGAAFVPAGLAAGLGLELPRSRFSIGLIVANVPEGLLPIITLALADGVRDLARRGAVIKRLASVETLGSVTVICTDKTGTLTENRMTVTRLWLSGGGAGRERRGSTIPARALLAATAAVCTTAEPPSDTQPAGAGDPTELALLRLAADLGVPVDPLRRTPTAGPSSSSTRTLKRMSTLDGEPGDVVDPHQGGARDRPAHAAPGCSTRTADPALSTTRPARDCRPRWTGTRRSGLRVLAIARRTLDPAGRRPDRPAPGRVGPRPDRAGRDGRPATRRRVRRRRPRPPRRDPHPCRHRRLRAHRSRDRPPGRHRTRRQPHHHRW